MQIVDLQYLPDSIHFVKNYTFAGYTRSHSILQEGRYLIATEEIITTAESSFSTC
ncbi:MAG: hypothetical protein IPG99_02585 [Ignavibacteria bacterium]|nr:hypothetical protein [Ignavibacteria bacterium]